MYKKGDLVECLMSAKDQFEKGKIYEVRDYMPGTENGFWEDGLFGQIAVTLDSRGSETNGWAEEFFKLYRRKGNKMSDSNENKYAELLEYSQGHDSRFKNLIFIDDNLKVIISTNGARLLVDRTCYEETKVLSRCIDSTGCMEYKDGVFVPSNKEVPDFKSIFPDPEKLVGSDYKRVRFTVPEWIKGVNEEEKMVYVSIILWDTPVLAIGEGYENSVTMNAHFLKSFSGKNVDLYLKKDLHTPITIVSSGEEVKTVAKFTMIMPIRKEKKGIPQYF